MSLPRREERRIPIRPFDPVDTSTLRGSFYFGQALESLTSRLDAISRSWDEEFQRAQAERASSEELARPVERTETGAIVFEPIPEPRPFESPASRSLRRARIARYVAKLEVDTRAEFARLHEAHRLDPAAFGAAADAWIDGTASAMPEALRGPFRVLASEIAGQHLAAIAREKEQEERRAAREEIARTLAMIQDDAVRLITRGESGERDFERALALLHQSRELWTPAEFDALRRRIVVFAPATAHVQRLIVARDETALRDVALQLQSSEPPKWALPLSPDERMALSEMATRAAAAIGAAREAKERAIRDRLADEIGEVWRSIWNANGRADAIVLGLHRLERAIRTAPARFVQSLVGEHEKIEKFAEQKIDEKIQDWLLELSDVPPGAPPSGRAYERVRALRNAFDGLVALFPQRTREGLERLRGKLITAEQQYANGLRAWAVQQIKEAEEIAATSVTDALERLGRVKATIGEVSQRAPELADELRKTFAESAGRVVDRAAVSMAATAKNAIDAIASAPDPEALARARDAYRRSVDHIAYFARLAAGTQLGDKLAVILAELYDRYENAEKAGDAAGRRERNEKRAFDVLRTLDRLARQLNDPDIDYGAWEFTARQARDVIDRLMTDDALLAQAYELSQRLNTLEKQYSALREERRKAIDRAATERGREIVVERGEAELEERLRRLGFDDDDLAAITRSVPDPQERALALKQALDEAEKFVEISDRIANLLAGIVARMDAAGVPFPGTPEIEAALENALVPERIEDKIALLENVATRLQEAIDRGRIQRSLLDWYTTGAAPSSKEIRAAAEKTVFGELGDPISPAAAVRFLQSPDLPGRLATAARTVGAGRIGEVLRAALSAPAELRDPAIAAFVQAAREVEIDPRAYRALLLGDDPLVSALAVASHLPPGMLGELAARASTWATTGAEALSKDERERIRNLVDKALGDRLPWTIFGQARYVVAPEVRDRLLRIAELFGTLFRDLGTGGTLGALSRDGLEELLAQLAVKTVVDGRSLGWSEVTLDPSRLVRAGEAFERVGVGPLPDPRDLAGWSIGVFAAGIDGNEIRFLVRRYPDREYHLVPEPAERWGVDVAPFGDLAKLIARGPVPGSLDFARDAIERKVVDWLSALHERGQLSFSGGGYEEYTYVQSPETGEARVVRLPAKPVLGRNVKLVPVPGRGGVYRIVVWASVPGVWIHAQERVGPDRWAPAEIDLRAERERFLAKARSLIGSATQPVLSLGAP